MESPLPESSSSQKTTVEPTREDRLKEALNTIWRGNPDRGIEQIRDLLADHPDYVDAWGNLGHQLITMGRLEEAIACCRKLIGIQPELVEAYQRMGDCYYALGRRREAYRVFKSLKGKPVYKTEDWRQRLALTEPLARRLLRRSLPATASFLGHLFDPRFLPAVVRETLSLKRSFPGIRAAGFPAFLSYLNQHYLETRSYRHPRSPCDLCGSDRFHAVFFFRNHKILKCENCGLECVERKPVDGQDVAEGAFDKDATIRSFEKMWDDPVLFEVRQSYLESLFRDAGESFPARGKKVLEIGCGQGHKLKNLADRGMIVTGTETGAKVIAQAREKFDLEVHNFTVRNLNFPDGSFDYILAYHVLEHLDRPSQLFAQSYRLLKPGGFLFIEIPTSDLTRADLVEKLNDAAGYANPSHMYFFQPETAGRYYRKYGFDLRNSYSRQMGKFLIGGFLGQKPGEGTPIRLG